MYNQDSIDFLVNRIGWADVQDDSLSIVINAENLVGTSGRTFKSFHELVTVENVYSATTKENPSYEEFNYILSEIRKQAVLKVLPQVIDKNYLSEISKDYSDIIIENSVLFDDAIGYQVAFDVLEKFVSTSRSNLLERNAKLTISNLKLELNGFRNENGYTVAKGVIFYLNEAIKRASNKLFPIEIIIQSPKDVW